MEKETVKAFDFEAAFKALDDIEMPAVIRTGSRVNANRINLHERFRAKSGHDALVEDYFDINNVDELEAAKDEREAEIAKAKLAKIEKIVDLEAETEEDILPSYVGKMIMQCPQCMTLFYKNDEDIEQSEENPEIVNLNEPCQHCGNTSGYNLVGKVGSVSEDEVDNFDVDDIEIAEDELNLDFPEETEEIDAEGTGDGADVMSDEEDLDLDLDTEEEVEEEPVEESLHRSDALKDAEEHSELATKQESEFKTLNESVLDDELNTKLDEHNDYIEYLKDAISAEEKALAAAKNEEIVAAINRKIEALKTDLEKALPDAVKAAVDVATDIVEDEVDEVTAEDAAEEIAEESVEESLNNSKALKDAKKHSELATEYGSENTALNEYFAEGLSDVYRKIFDKPASTATQQAWEAELNGEMGKISAKRRAELERKFAQQRAWEARHEVETEAETEVAVPAEKPLNEAISPKVEAEIKKHIGLYTEKIDMSNNGDEIQINSELVDTLPDKEKGHKEMLDALNKNGYTVIGDQYLHNSLLNKHLSFITVKAKTEKPLNEAADVRIFVDQSGSLVGRKDEIMARVAADYPGSENQIEFFDDAECAGPMASAEAGQKVVVYTNGDCEANCPNLCKIATIKNIDIAEAPVEEALEAETELTEDAELDKLLDELWDGPQPTEAEIQAILDGPRFEEDLEIAEDFDEKSFDKHLTEYFTNVYSNVEAFNSTGCAVSGKQLVVEGCIKFKSGKTKATKFIFESTDRGLVGKNTDFSMTESFRLSTKLANKVLITEGIKYRYSIGESLVHGNTKKK